MSTIDRRLILERACSVRGRLSSALDELERADDPGPGADLISVAQAMTYAIALLDALFGDDPRRVGHGKDLPDDLPETVLEALDEPFDDPERTK